jgi:hypothetical protein
LLDATFTSHNHLPRDGSVTRHGDASPKPLVEELVQRFTDGTTVITLLGNKEPTLNERIHLLVEYLDDNASDFAFPASAKKGHAAGSR